jgi:hypothetical protein
LWTASLGLLVCFFAVGSAHADLQEIERAWQALRERSRHVDYELESVTFTAQGGLGASLAAPDVRVPPSAETHPGELRFVIDFVNGRLRRDVSLWLYYDVNGEKAGFRKAPSTYAFDGKDASRIQPFYADAAQRRATRGQGVPEFFEHYREDRHLLYELPILWSHGYFLPVDKEEIGMLTKPLPATTFRQRPDVEQGARRLTVLYSPPHPRSPESFDELWLDPELGYRVVRCRRWSRNGAVRQEFAFEYERSSDDARLTAVHWTRFDRESGGIAENTKYSVKKADINGTLDSDVFQLSPEPYMWVEDMETGRVYQYRPPSAFYYNTWTWVALTASLLLLIVLVALRYRRLRLSQE